MSITVSELIASYEEQISSLESSLSQLDVLDESLTDQGTAVTGICTEAQQRLVDYLTNTKAPSISPTAHVVLGAGFGTIGYENTLSQWEIWDMVAQPLPPPPDPPLPDVDQAVYSHTVNWDNDPQIMEYMADWAEANDMLTRPMTSGATYGIQPYQANITTASNILTENKEKLESSVVTFGKYA